MGKLNLDSSCSFLKSDDTNLTDEHIADLKNMGIAVYIVSNGDTNVEINLYTFKNYTLSDYIPILENLGFRYNSEISYRLFNDEYEIFCRKYVVECEDNEKFKAHKENIAATIVSTFTKEIKNTPLNGLSYSVNLSVADIRLVRAIASYEDQIIAEQNEIVISKTLICNPTIVSLFVEYFHTKFQQDIKNRDKKLQDIESKIVDHLKSVADITQDRILNVFFLILKALTRTNYYKAVKNFKDIAFSFKIDISKIIDHLSGLQPRTEIFVYHHEFVGIHLRRRDVSRGGLRWSDREQDYRSEIRSLMQAQRSKNAVIIPSGAKGGFYIFEEKPSREKFKIIYSMFINALLDVVDNRVAGEIVQNKNQVIYDEPDSYFVVAADKGTSAMSDVANAISQSRGFWLGDAFASGGSNGYNHKAMGITAKGSIKSSERYFIEQNINIYETPINVIGIGSPSGDVFGNGILLSTKFRLIAAISSKYLFVDPSPDLEKSYKERERLFKDGLGWENYNTELISQGGGIYKKSDKSIKLSQEAKKALGIKKDLVNGEELSRAILSAKTDLLFNGGVGTYVKGDDESNASIGDKPNESVRIKASDIKAYAICEGGNLGFTQKARMELSKRGVRISADSIDNSAGVQTSDYEVNIKIILNALMDKGIITNEHKSEVLHSLEGDVERVVLWTNYFQSLALSLDEIRSKKDINQFIKTLSVLEDSVENFIPKDYEIPNHEELKNAITKNGTLLRPLLSVLISYAKIFLKSVILNDKDLLESDIANSLLLKYFPKSFTALYNKDINRHPLKNVIIATMIANIIIDNQGSSFICDYKELGEKAFVLKIESYLVLNEVISGNDIRYEIFRQDYKISVKKQYEMLLDMEDTLNFLYTWITEHGRNKTAIFDRVSEYKKSLTDFISCLCDESKIITLCESDSVNRFYGLIDYIRMLTTIISVKENTNQNFVDVANLFYSCTQDLEILALHKYIKDADAANEWEERLREKLMVDVYDCVFKIIEDIMRFKRSNESITEAFASFVKINKKYYELYAKDLKNLKSSHIINLVNLSVVIGSLAKIATDAES